MNNKAKAPRRRNGAQSKTNELTSPILPETGDFDKGSVPRVDSRNGEPSAIYLHGLAGFRVFPDAEKPIAEFVRRVKCVVQPVHDLDLCHYEPGLVRFRILAGGQWSKRVFSGDYSVVWGKVM